MKHIEVGPYRYEVYVSPVPLQDYNGMLDTNSRTVVVDGTLSAASQRDTVLHEVLHAIIDMTGQRASGKDEEEALVASLTPWLLLVMRDNPKLLRYLTADSS